MQDYYGDNEDAIVMCHNDLHPGNMMVNKEGNFDPTQLVFVDYDNAGYGYRAFDLIYNMMNWPFEKDPEAQYRWYNTFLTDYVDDATGHSYWDNRMGLVFKSQQNLSKLNNP